jgi:hypothetical protein
MRVAILGCGPAGLIAAHAVNQMSRLDIDITIFSRNRKSHMYGAQYLHIPIPDMSFAEPVKVSYTLTGTNDGYRRKVYGDLPFIGQVSTEALPESHMAWDIREAYDNLWNYYSSYIINSEITPEAPLSLRQMGADLIISTVPAPLLCDKGHVFRSQQIWAAGEAHDRDIRLPYSCPENTVLCNGNDEPAWYRLSNIFGVKTVEWSVHNVKNKPPVATAGPVDKPINTNCDCWPEVVRAGRYGTWRKGVLSSDAYKTATSAVLNASK